ncbi:MAG TPA: hypothetical protein VF519_05045 [Mycobacteriales bacterium]|jgi:hypothetical protein
MRTLLATALVAAAALPLTGTAGAASFGCVRTRVDAIASSTGPGVNLVYVDDQGRIVIDPNGADAAVQYAEGHLTALVNCLGRCAAEFLLGGSPAPITLVYVDDQGRVVVDPHGADAFVGYTAAQLAAFVRCAL